MRNIGWIVVGLFVVGLAGCGGKKSGPGGLNVTGSPTGEVDGEVRVILAFSKPMVGKDKIGQVATTAPFSLVPDLAHEMRWSDDKTLVVVPTASLPISTKFTVTVPADAKAIDGATLGKATSFEFFTERLSGTIEVVGSKDRAVKNQLVKLTFNHEVAWDQVEKNCTFSAKSGSQKLKIAPDTSAGPAKQYSVMPAADLALDTDWTLTCKPDLKGVVGNIGLEAAVDEKLHTYGPLKYVDLDPKGNDIVPDENLKLKLIFSNPLAEPFKLKIVPPVAGFPQGCHAMTDDPVGVSCTGAFEALTSYTITVEAEQKDTFGQKLGKEASIDFRTADAKPTISMEDGYFVGELKRPVVPLWTRNVTKLDVTLVPVTQDNFHEVIPLLDWWEHKPADFKKTHLKPVSKQIAVTGTKNKWAQNSLDPATLLGGTPGPGMYYVEIGSSEVEKGAFVDGGRKKVLVNFTNIGVVSKLSSSRGVVWATNLTTGKALPGASVSVRDGTGKVTWTGTTDNDGVAVLPGNDKIGGTVTEYGERVDDLRIYVQQGPDWTMINPSASGGLSPWSFNVSVDRSSGATKLRGFMQTDRGLYRPGDKVHVKGLARVTKLGEPLAIPNTGKKVAVEVESPQGKTIFSTDAKLSPFGGFWFDIDVPGDARLGDYTVRAKLEHGTFTRTFTVEEFRAATFEVNGKTKENLMISRGDVHGTVSANYFYGAPVRNGSVDVNVYSRKKRVSFDKLPDFDFGDERHWESYYYYESNDSQSMVTDDHVSLDAKGNANFTFSVSPNDIYSDADLLIRADVHSPSNEVISKSFTIPYFRSKKYFGIKSPGYFLDVKKPAKFQIVSAAPDGKVIDSSAKVKVTRTDWNCVWEDWGYRGSYECKDQTQTILEKTVAISGGKPGEIEFTPATGGDYLVVVEGDADTQPAAQRLYAWGDDTGSWRSDDTLSFDIATDKTEYKAGDTATLILKTDLKNATGLVTIERDGVIEKRLIEVTPTTKHIQVPITAAMAPNIYVSVALVQGRTGDGPRGKPRMRMGVANLPVRPEDNRLTVTVEPDKKEYRPGDDVKATVKVTDSKGQPVSAEVSITAADEGVLSLIAYQTPDPVPTMYASWGLGVTSATQLEYIRDIPAPNIERPATGGDSAGSVRSHFVASAVWVPGAVTDASGIATVTFKAPDNLTAFRLMAVAADKGYRFGSADKRFAVNKPLQLHAALPRFVQLGDAAKAGVVVHNETGKAGQATVKVVGDEHLAIRGALEQTVKVDAGGRVPVLFDLDPTAQGTAALTFSVSMNNEKDAVRLELPVKHPGNRKIADVEHGTTKDTKTIAVNVPADAVPSTAEIIISVDPDGLSGIEEGLDELIGYPYGCMEQTTSKMLAMIAVRDLAESLGIEGLRGDLLDKFVKEGITKINRQQTTYGGFSLWPGGEPNAFYTAYGLWGLYTAQKAGYPVDTSRIEEALDYLRGDGLSPDKDLPVYSEMGDLAAQSFSAYVRALYKDKGAAAVAQNLLKEGKLPIYGKVYAARALAMSVGAKDPAVQAVVAELEKLAADAVKADTLLNEPNEKDGDYYMSSDMRTTSAVLLGLVELDPKNAVIKPFAMQVMKGRRKTDVWDTHSNFYSLLSLTTYAKSVSGNPPSVSVKLGDKELITGTLSGKAKMRVVTAPLPQNAQLEITPKGEVAYNVDVRYRAKPETIKAEEHGIKISREYLDEAGKPKTAYQVGDVVQVVLHVEVPDDSTNLMVSDALPAGFEALNTRLATVGAATVKQSPTWWGDYREMHDERVDFASEYIYEGTFEYRYSIRAIASGKFVRPPATAELMYDPKTNGQTALDYLEIKAK